MLHTRIVRWDQSGTVFQSDGVTAWAGLNTSGATGLAGAMGIPVPPAGTTLILESGITVAFGQASTSNTFQTDDFWNFAARTADSAVEVLNAASPLGVYHHYVRLAYVDFSLPGGVDLRRCFQTLANPCIQVTSVTLGSSSGTGSTGLASGGTITIQALLTNGITVLFDSVLPLAVWDPTAPSQNCPLFTVSLDIAVPGAAGALMTVVLPSTVVVGYSPSTPPAAAAPVPALTWTAALPQQAAFETLFVSSTPPVLARLKLKGNSIWSQTDLAYPPVFLNGIGDGRPSADYELDFWLVSQPAISVSATTLDFGDQTVGTPSAAKTVTLTNSSTSEVTINSITAPAGFTATAGGVTSIAPSPGSCFVSVTFNPEVAQTLSGTLTINESADPEIMVSLTGTGVQAQATVSPSLLIFSPTPPYTVVGSIDFSSQILVLTNNGSLELTVTSIVTGTASFTVLDSGALYTCDPGVLDRPAADRLQRSRFSAIRPALWQCHRSAP